MRNIHSEGLWVNIWARPTGGLSALPSPETICWRGAAAGRQERLWQQRRSVCLPETTAHNRLYQHHRWLAVLTNQPQEYQTQPEPHVRPPPCLIHVSHYSSWGEVTRVSAVSMGMQPKLYNRSSIGLCPLLVPEILRSRLTHSGDRAFAVKTPRLWNDPSEDIRATKSLLKTHLFTICFLTF